MARNPGEDAQHPKGLVIPKPKKRPPATNGEEGFINPYNFVRWAPAVHKCAPPTHEKFAGRSGRITVELTNITPLCIPDPKETDKFPIKDDPKGKERFWKPFMRVDGRPYIPGSSLKGMLRSVAEAVSNSCYLVFADKGDDPAVFRDNRDFAVNYRRLARLKEKADGSYVVQDVHPDIGIPPVPPCEPRQPTDIWKARNNLYRNNRQRLFPDDPNRTKPAPTDVEERFWQGNQSFSWYDFLRGMFGDTERRDCGPDGRPLVVRRRGKVVQNNRPKDPVRRPGEPVIIRWPVADQRTKSAEYRIETNVQNLYQRVTGSKTFRRFHDEAVNLKRWQVDYLKPGNNELFWYRRRFNSQDVCELGRNFRYKWAYDLTAGLPTDLHPCKRVANLCPACGIFGMVDPEEGGEDAFAGRISIGPALWESGNSDTANVDDHIILGAPKFSCRSFYLKATHQDCFNVSQDEFVHIDEDGRIIPNEIRGRKFYWHHTKLWNKDRDVKMEALERSEYNNRRPEETDQNARIEILLEGAKFKFHVDFENLGEWELGLLLWAIALPDVENGGHHLGLGKPIGLGTVKLRIENVELIDRKDRYSSVFATGIRRCDDVSPYVDAFRRKMESWNGVDDFGELPNVQDLKVILSQDYPGSDDVRICYPPGDNPDKKTGEETTDNVHPSELNYKWFCSIMKWSEPLATIQQIANGEYQNITDEEGN